MAAAAAAMADEDMPEHFMCPLTMDVMVDPVLAADGHNYEREALVQWLATNPRSPITQEPLQPGQFLANAALRREIAKWWEEQRVSIAPHLLTVGAELGRGATGVVFCGELKRSKGSPLAVAIKMLQGGAPAEAVAALEREVSVLRRISRDCPLVVQLLGTSVKDGQLCIVMKRYARNLRAAIRAAPGGRLGPNTALMMARNLFVAVAELHQHDIISRDIKPEY